MEKLVTERKFREKIKLMNYDDAMKFKSEKYERVFDTFDDNKEISDGKTDKIRVIEEENDEDKEDDEEEFELSSKVKEKIGEEKFSKLLELKSRLNTAKTLNREAVTEESKAQQIPNYSKQKMKDEMIKQSKNLASKLEKQGICLEKHYLQDSISKCEYKKEELLKKKRSEAFGWEGI